MLYDFWTYSCINCQRTFPYIRSWFDRYTADGLVIIGIHSPEFDFEKVHKNVEAAVKRDDVTWPVALDDDMTIWNEFKNQYWPADYIADRNGHIRYTHFGEGDYTEHRERDPQAARRAGDAPRAQPKVTNGDATSPGNSNPETYLGPAVPGPGAAADRDPAGRARLPGTAGRIDRGAAARSGGQIALSPGKIEGALVGKWTADDEAVTSDAPAATILLGVHAKEVNLVMATKTGKPIDARRRARRAAGAGRRPRLERARRRQRPHGRDRAGARHVPAPVEPDGRRITCSASRRPRPGLEAYDFTFG